MSDVEMICWQITSQLLIIQTCLLDFFLKCNYILFAILADVDIFYLDEYLSL